MRKWILLFILFVFYSCQQSVNQSDISKINGYWEIIKVVVPGEEKKEYTINETFDFYEINGATGTRTKVNPQLDGTFLTNGVSEKFEFVAQDDKMIVKYTTPHAKWEEEIISLSDSIMVVRNVDNKEFHYKKTGPVNLLGDGKKNQ